MKRIKKNGIKLFRKVIIYVITRILRVLNERQKIKFISYFLKALENSNDSLVTYIERSITHNKIPTGIADNENLCSNLGIVIQGPLKMEKNFTLESVRLYNKIFPKATIVISTWEGEDRVYLDSIKKEGAFVIENTKPVKSGVGNINYQVKSTKSGLVLVKEKGCAYAIKTRTDQRLSRNGLFEYLLSLQEIFPVENIFDVNQKERIIVSEGNVQANMLIPFHISDFFYFGVLDDLLSFFDLEEDEQHFSSRIERFKLSEKLKAKNVSLASYHHSLAPEAVLTMSYLNRLGIDFDSESVFDSWNFVKSYLISLSWDDLDLIWNKYEESYNEGLLRNISNNNGKDPYFNFTWSFNNWLLVQQGKIKLKIEYEEYCKKGVSNYL
jgi:hypothetical protein